MSSDPPPASGVEASTAHSVTIPLSLPLSIPKSIPSSDPTAYLRVPSTKPGSSRPLFEEVRLDSIEDVPDEEFFNEVGQTVANRMGPASSERLITLLTRLANQSRALVIPTTAPAVSVVNPVTLPLSQAPFTPLSGGFRPRVLFPGSREPRPNVSGSMGNFQSFPYFSLTPEQMYIISYDQQLFPAYDATPVHDDRTAR
ncbi:hypothetical protein M5689_012931 [Euphorbia peplus]|nr:hypothetical protein M5689_012931 [Euphorbia peplus]